VLADSLWPVIAPPSWWRRPSSSLPPGGRRPHASARLEVARDDLIGGQGTRGARLEEHTCEKKPDLPAHVASEKNGAP